MPLADLLRQSIYSRLAGYEDVNDAERLSQDPTFRLIGSEKIWDRGAALTSRLQSFETELLTQEENFSGLVAINGELMARAESLESAQRVVLDMDSTEIAVYSEQEQSAYNGHFKSTCYHPLLLFNGAGDCLAAKLHPGNVHSAEGWEELLLPEIERQEEQGKEIAFRADAAFAKPEIYETLEERGVQHAIRIPANDNLERDIAELVPRPVGRPSKRPLVEYKGFLYQRPRHVAVSAKAGCTSTLSGIQVVEEWWETNGTILEKKLWSGIGEWPIPSATGSQTGDMGLYQHGLDLHAACGAPLQPGPNVKFPVTGGMRKDRHAQNWLLVLLRQLNIAGIFVLLIHPLPGQVGPVTGVYVMSFHACDTATANCMDPRNHRVYLAQSNDGAAWSIIPRWTPFSGSVPDVIRRGSALYIYTAGKGVARYHLDTNTLEAPIQVTVTGVPSGFVDPSLILDDQGRLVLFFLYGRGEGDPAGCPAGQSTCANRFGSATEVVGSDGTQFTLDPGDRATVALNSAGPVKSASDPDIFFDGRQYVLYTSHGPSVWVWTLADLRGTYAKVADLSNDTGGVPSGYYDATTSRYWTYTHVTRSGVSVIRRAVHADFSRTLTESDWTTVMTGSGLGLTATTSVESPGFAVNTEGASASVDLAAAKTAASGQIALGEQLTYTISATNLSASAASGVTVTDVLPSSVSFVSASASQGSCSRATSTLTCALGALAAGAAARVTLIVAPTTVGSLSNTATVRGNEIDPVIGNNTATATVMVSYALHFAQLGNGAGITSDAVFTNGSAVSPAVGKLEFFDDNGLPLEVGIAGLGPLTSVDVTVPPLGVATVFTDGAGTPIVGSARFLSDSRVGGVVRFAIVGVGIAGVGESQPVAGFIVPVRRKSGEINTGAAIRNVAGSSVALTLTLRDRQGIFVAGASRNLNPGGHLAQFVNELFPGAPTDNFQGTLSVQASGGKVAATALELGSQAGQFTTLPVTPLP
ncbi:MAG: transposase [Acidobacteria bacterium]|nr:transposase [Acidobacteriota bacterium]